MNLYDEFHPTAVELLADFGERATLTASAPPKTTMAEKRGGKLDPRYLAPQSRTTQAVVRAIRVTGQDGVLRFPTVATMLLEPQQGDTLRMGSLTWKVGAVTRVAPQGKAIIYMAEVS